MQFKFKTIRKTRNALNAQQIYWEFFKLKKYLKVRSIFGEPKVPQITFHRQQLPYRHQTIDMDLYVEQMQTPSMRLHYLAIAMCTYVVSYYFAQLLYDDAYRYYVSIRFPWHMYFFDKALNSAVDEWKHLEQLMELQNKETQGPVGYHNIKQGLLKLLLPSRREKIDMTVADGVVMDLNTFLQEQDSRIVQSIK